MFGKIFRRLKNASGAFVLFFLLCLVSRAGAARDLAPLNSYWAKTEFDFRKVRIHVTNFICVSDLSHFVGCVDAINVALRKSNLFLVPSLQAKDFPILKDFDYFKVIQREATTLETRAQYVERTRREQRENFDSLVSAFKNLGGQTVNFEEILDWTYENFVKDSEKEAEISGRAVNAFLAATVDPHTYYVPTQWQKDRMERQDGDDYIGTGLQLKNVGEKVFVERAYDESPAMKAGLRRGDQIMQIDDHELKASKLREFLDLLDGAENTTVKVTVLRKKKTYEFQIVRGKVLRPLVVAKNAEIAGMKVGYIQLRSFAVGSCEIIKKKIQDAKTYGAKAILFDLRNDLGGRLVEAVCIGGIFLGKRNIVTEKKLPLEMGVSADHIAQEDAIYDGPLAVFVNASSASASEIVAGAIQDYQRGYLFGSRSYGKATVQYSYDQPGGVTYAKTEARFYQPTGRTNQVVGVEPDFEVWPTPTPTPDDMAAFYEADNSPMVLPPLGPAWSQPRPLEIATLKACADNEQSALKNYLAQVSESSETDYSLWYAVEILKCQDFVLARAP